ncbi:MAG: cytosine-specific methylase family protein [Moraxellaceae bacterium]|jgi:DNA (cytosine-5)-methyltransferase 1|nr:cytosine-specific methylase family protein [Moraxellaceae bacterium]
MNELALFAGAGLGVLGGHLLGWRTVCAVECSAYAAQVLAQRQNDGILRPFPIWSDVRSFDGRPWCGLVDVVSGGFPCQDISTAGTGRGLDGERSGLWREMHRIIGEVRPQYVFIENSAALVTRGLERVLCDLAALGFNAEWGVISAADLDAPHRRERIWIVANADSSREQQCAEAGNEARHRPGDGSAHLGYSNGEHWPEGRRQAQGAERKGGYAGQPGGGSGGAGSFADWPAEPAMGRVAYGMPHRVDRLEALGNGQVPRVAAAAFAALCRG